MIRLAGVTLARGAKVLLDGATLAIATGKRVGLIGANGSGKSSLFALLRGEAHADRGEVEMPPRWVIAHVAQETPAVERAALDYVLDGDAELREIEAGLAAAQTGHADGETIAELHHRYEAIGGYGARARAATLLHGLGFASAEHPRPVAGFSGGWRMRLNLAQALMTRSDLLLLDEPTNHLDLDAVLWLEDWLRGYAGTLLLISHDRDFLDAVVDQIVHIDQRKLRAYGGNYSQFERERVQQLALQQAAYEKQQRTIAHLQSFVDRFKAKATKAKQAQSRIKAIERMELIAAAHVDSPFSFAFPPPARAPRQLVRFEEASLGYGGDGRIALRDVDFALLAEQRIGLLGPNGAGKSTLVKAIADGATLLAGERYTGQGLAIGYFAQHQVEQLRLEESPLWHLQRIDPAAREQDLRDFLGGFDFRGDVATSPVAPLSGGEKARLTLALLVYRRPNLLLLDEPTNHLDIEMREALTEALQDYAGSLVVVAHDRHLLRATTDELWLVADGRVQPFAGDLDDYRDWVLAKRRSETRAGAASAGSPIAGLPATDTGLPANAAVGLGTAPGLPASAAEPPAAAAGLPASAESPSRKAQRRADAEERQRLAALRRPLQRELETVERRLGVCSAERRELQQWLGSSEAYAEANRERLQSSIWREGKLAAEIDELEAQWLALQERLEGIGV
jgi:ATP-binding cassette subfamily F protein 3